MIYKTLIINKGTEYQETFNGTGWAYNDNSIVAFYIPKID